MTCPKEINDFFLSLCKSSQHTDKELIKNAEAYNIEVKDESYRALNRDPFVVFTLTKKVSCLGVFLYVTSGNRSNHIKIYYASDYDFSEDKIIDLGNVQEKEIQKIVKFNEPVNMVRIDFGDYNSSLCFHEIGLKESSEFLYNIEILKKCKTIGEIAWHNKSLIRKAFHEFKYNGLTATISKINAKVDVKSHFEQIDAQFEEYSDKIIVCIHDLSKAGAQLLSYTIVKSLVDTYKFKVVLITLASGELLPLFEEKVSVINLNQTFITEVVHRKQLIAQIDSLKKQGFHYAICNSSATGILTQMLTECGISCIGLVHELPTTLKDYGLTEIAKLHGEYAKTLVFASNYVKNAFLEYTKLSEMNCKIYPQAINKPPKVSRNEARKTILKRYALPDKSRIILGSGVGGLRKGIDAFLEVAKKCISSDTNYIFIWAGTLDKEVKNWILHDIQVLNLSANIKILDFVSDMNIYEAASDIFLMTSREDPFPSTVMEAMYYGTPVISFDHSGGIPELLINNRGIVVGYMDTEAMAVQIHNLYDNPEYYQLVSKTGQDYVETNFNADQYTKDLLTCLEYPFVNRTQVSEPYKAHIRYPLEHDRKKILHFIDNFSTGGSSKLVVDIVEWLGHKYEQVIVANYHPEQIEYVGVDVVTLSESESNEAILKFIFDFKPDIIHVHYWESRWYTKIIDLLEKCSDCVIVENVNIPVAPYVKPYIDKYVFVSNYTLKEYGSDPAKSIVVYPGSDFSFFTRSLEGDYLPDDTIGMVYRLDIDKLTDFSIDVFIRVVQKRPHTHALIVGGGPRYNQYYAKVKQAGLLDNFTFTGFVPYDTLPDYYKKFTIFVAPVWQESFGQVSPFAMNMGIPVVGYNIGALYEITNNATLLADFEDIEQISDILVDLLNNKKRCLEIGQYNAARAKKYFTLEKMIKDYETLYSDLLKKKKT